MAAVAITKDEDEGQKLSQKAAGPPIKMSLKIQKPLGCKNRQGNRHAWPTSRTLPRCLLGDLSEYNLGA